MTYLLNAFKYVGYVNSSLIPLSYLTFTNFRRDACQTKIFEKDGSDLRHGHNVSTKQCVLTIKYSVKGEDHDHGSDSRSWHPGIPVFQCYLSSDSTDVLLHAPQILYSPLYLQLIRASRSYQRSISWSDITGRFGHFQMVLIRLHGNQRNTWNLANEQ
jgi:hypothetical protein